MIRILIVDDQPGVLAGLRMQFALEPDFDVVGDAGDGATAIVAAQALCPDVIVMDARMPEMDGIQATAALQKLAPNIHVVILTLHDDTLTRATAHSAGATAFVAKHEPADVLFRAIRDAAKHD